MEFHSAGIRTKAFLNSLEPHILSYIKRNLNDKRKVRAALKQKSVQLDGYWNNDPYKLLKGEQLLLARRNVQYFLKEEVYEHFLRFNEENRWLVFNSPEFKDLLKRLNGWAMVVVDTCCPSRDFYKGEDKLYYVSKDGVELDSFYTNQDILRNNIVASAIFPITYEQLYNPSLKVPLNQRRIEVAFSVENGLRKATLRLLGDVGKIAYHLPHVDKSFLTNKVYEDSWDEALSKISTMDWEFMDIETAM